MLALSPRPARSATLSPTSTNALRVAPVSVAAGFPSPAQDYYDGAIDLTEMLVHDHAATFIVRAAGDSMTEAGIRDGDELLVDRSKTPRHDDAAACQTRTDLVRCLFITRDPSQDPGTGTSERAGGRCSPSVHDDS